MNRPEPLPVIDHGVLRFLTCGSVDDGKSTLIGRLLYDTQSILEDTLHVISNTSRKRGLDTIDLSLLTDGLIAEREQGITIDVAYRYFSTGTRKYIIADAPGHEQYTRNMVTAASTADLAIILVDARHGVLPQTRRHSVIAHRLGIPHVIVAINKMDLCHYDQAVFERIRSDYLDFAQQLGIGDVRFVPISALDGDMIVERGDHLGWYAGPTLLEILESAAPAHSEHAEPFRFPVQYVCRPRQAADPQLHDFRGYMGRIESGEIAIGDPVSILRGGRMTRVVDIRIGGESQPLAIAGQSVTLLLADDIDVSRGDMIAKPDALPSSYDVVAAELCWFSTTPLDTRRTYLIHHTTREVRARLSGGMEIYDLGTLRHLATDTVKMNDIARVHFRLARPIFGDRYEENRATGAFIVIDEASNDTVGAGMIL
ncbi:MAG: sulfate adenylyltransferase subunit 1 [Rhodocyclaceae bacterium]